MIRPRVIAGALVVFVAASTVQAVAQTGGSLRLDVPVQRGTLPAGAEDSQQQVSGGANLDYLFAGERGRFFYDSALDRFDGDGTWSTWLHNVGLAGAFDAGALSWETGVAAFWRANGGGWSDAGFRGFTVAAAAERRFDGLTFSGGYNVYARWFPDAPPLDQLEHYGHARVLANLETRTTLVGTVTLGRKRYDGEATSLEAMPTAPPSVEGHAGQLRGRRWLTAPAPSTGEEATRRQWTWSARIAQSLTDRTGAWVEYERRATGGDPAPLVVWTPPTFYDDGVYDDPYAIDAVTWRAGVKHVFSRGPALSASVSHSDRDYAGVLVTTAEELTGPARADRLLRGGIEASLPIGSVRAFDLDLVTGYGYVYNQSNDLLEQYRAHIFSAGLRAGF